MMSDDKTYHLGDKIRLRSGPYAGRIGIVVRVNALEHQRPSGALVMIKLSDGKINPCYVSNLEKIE